MILGVHTENNFFFGLRPPTTKDWYHDQIRNFEEIKKIKNIKEGDIITDNSHMGIVSYNEGWKTISAGENEILENDWGIKRSCNPIRIFRYKKGANLWPERAMVIH